MSSVNTELQKYKNKIVDSYQQTSALGVQKSSSITQKTPPPVKYACWQPFFCRLDFTFVILMTMTSIFSSNVGVRFRSVKSVRSYKFSFNPYIILIYMYLLGCAKKNLIFFLRYGENIVRNDEKGSGIV